MRYDRDDSIGFLVWYVARVWPIALFIIHEFQITLAGVQGNSRRSKF